MFQMFDKPADRYQNRKLNESNALEAQVAVDMSQQIQ